MKRITFLTLLSALLMIPFTYGQSLSLTSLERSNTKTNSDAITSVIVQRDNIKSTTIIITNNLGQTSSGIDIACATSTDIVENTIWNEYDLGGNFGITTDFNVTSVEFGIGAVSTGSAVPITISVYSNDGIFPVGTWTLQGTASYIVTDTDDNTIVSVPLSATIPAGDNLLFEIYNPDMIGTSNLYRYMTNEDGALADSWLLAPGCGLSSPATLTSIGFGYFIMNVLGDSNAPVISCPADISVDVLPGTCGAVVNFADATAVDVEDGVVPVVQTVGLPSGSEFPIGVSYVEFSATDSDGNIVICSFSVTVNDTENPVAVCQDITVELDANGTVTVAPADFDAGSSDNCGTTSFSFGGGSTTTGSLTTLFAQNNGGSTGGAVYFDITVGPSKIDLTGFDINTGDAGAFTMDVYTLVGTAVGNESNAAAWGSSATGASGTGAGEDNPSNATLNTPIILNANTTYGIALVLDATHGHKYTNGDGSNQAFSNADLSIALGAASNTPFDSSTFSPRIFNGTIHYSVAIPGTDGVYDCSEVGANIVTLLVTDASGNTDSCMATVTVEDNQAPVVICKGGGGAMTMLENFESCTLPVGWSLEAQTGYDHEGGCDAPGVDGLFSFSCTDGDYIGFPDASTGLNANITGCKAVINDDNAGSSYVGVATILSSVIDLSSGTGVSLSFDYMFNNMGSAIFYVELWDGASWNEVLNTGTNDTTDSPTIDISAYSNADFQVKFVHDDGGSWAWGVALDNLIVNYTTASTPPLEVVLDATGHASVDLEDLFISIDDNCDYTIAVGGGSGGGGTACEQSNPGNNFENAYFTDPGSGFIVANDVTVDPDIDFTMDHITANLFHDPGATITTIDLTYYENNSGQPGAIIGSENGVSSSSQTVVGNAFGFDVSEVDFNITPFLFASQSGISTSYWVSMVVNSSVGGITAWELTTASSNGYESLSSPDGTTWNGGSGDGVYTFSGTCGGAKSRATTEFDCSNLGENQVDVTVTDAGGNTATCTATVIVTDETAPVLICEDKTIEIGADGTTTIDPYDLMAVYPSTYEAMVIGSDNQSAAEGFTDFTVAITDAANLSFDWNYTTNDDPGYDRFGYLLNGVFTMLADSNSSGSSAVTVASGDVFGFRSHTDDNLFGNNETLITNFMPGYTGQFAPANWTLTLDNSDGDAYITEIPGGTQAYDACGIDVIMADLTEVTCADIGSTILVSVFANDASGNFASCQSTITVVDAMEPTLTCPDAATYGTEPSNNDGVYIVRDYYDIGATTYSDNCTDNSTLVVTQDPAPGTEWGINGSGNPGPYVVTFTVTDESGNVATCTLDVIVTNGIGVTENTLLDNALNMYPNPATNLVKLVNTSDIALESAMIYDINGKLITELDLNNMGTETIFDVSHYANGIYMVKIIGENASTVKRLIKE